MSETKIPVSVLAPKIANRLSLPNRSVTAALDLIRDGCTIPFIARYRKDKTNGLTDEQLRKLDISLKELTSLEERRASIRQSLEKLDLLTAGRAQELDSLGSKQALEDFYRPFKPSRHTKAAKAKARGLGALAKALLNPSERGSPEALALAYVSPEKDVKDIEEALQGAQDIIVEDLADRAELREKIREERRRGFVTAKAARGKKEALAASVYKDLVGSRARVSSMRGHRVLAIDRGEREGLLSVSVEGSQEWEMRHLQRTVLSRNKRAADAFIVKSLERCLKERLGPACERDVRRELTEKAQLSAIETFRINLRALLRTPPLERRRVLGIDPGFRSGCKCAAVDAHGTYLVSETIQPHGSLNAKARAAETLLRIVEKYRCDVIAIGNGTASRETQAFTRETLKNFKKHPVTQIIVNEDGASVYSASALAAEEHPDLDVTIRGALSIARRVLDPLAEFVKIDPKSLGIGQYQHDIDAKQLDAALSGVVEQVVNEVGVDLNRASRSLLGYVSGITTRLAKSIVKAREKKPFTCRNDLLKVSGLGPKTFEQSAGFLRVLESSEVLDKTSVHPESYDIARRIAQKLGTKIGDLANNKDRLKRLEAKDFVTSHAGLATISDILEELAHPGRDPRGEATTMEYDESVKTMEDLVVGSELPGTVKNVTDFGAFIDIGVHRDGLIHISKFGKRVEHPSDMVHVGQRIKVRVEQVDLDRKRISLSYVG